MFWRGLDPQHPLHGATGADARGAIEWIYRETDRILGRTLAAMQPGDRLVVLSDHGFAPFRRAVHLNRWLADQGLLALRRGRAAGDAHLVDIDWVQTKAYALGLNGIYINRRGREGQGIVDPAEAAAIKTRIRSSLPQVTDGDGGPLLVREVYDGADIYRGGATAAAPDLVVGYQRGYRASWQTALGETPVLLGSKITAPTGVATTVLTRRWSPGCYSPPSPLPEPVDSIQDLATLVSTGLGVGELFPFHQHHH